MENAWGKERSEKNGGTQGPSRGGKEEGERKKKKK